MFTWSPVHGSPNLCCFEQPFELWIQATAEAKSGGASTHDDDGIHRP